MHCRHPFITVISHCARAFETDWGHETSHFGVATLTPQSLNSMSSLQAVSDCGPDRESRIRFLAPFFAIQRAAHRPSPPRPPAITNVALGSSLYEDLAGREVLGCQHTEASNRCQIWLELTGTRSVGSMLRTIFPVCLPLFRNLNASSAFDIGNTCSG